MIDVPQNVFGLQSIHPIRPRWIDSISHPSEMWPWVTFVYFATPCALHYAEVVLESDDGFPFARDTPVCPACGNDEYEQDMDCEYQVIDCSCGITFEAQRHIVSRQLENRS